jgi:hypothetical protein
MKKWIWIILGSVLFAVLAVLCVGVVLWINRTAELPPVYETTITITVQTQKQEPDGPTVVSIMYTLTPDMEVYPAVKNHLEGLQVRRYLHSRKSQSSSGVSHAMIFYCGGSPGEYEAVNLYVGSEGPYVSCWVSPWEGGELDFARMKMVNAEGWYQELLRLLENVEPDP